MLGSTKGNICQLNPKNGKKAKNSKQTKKSLILLIQKKVFTINEHSGMPYVITGISFICLEHSMTGSYKEDGSVKVAGKPENPLWFR